MLSYAPQKLFKKRRRRPRFIKPLKKRIKIFNMRYTFPKVKYQNALNRALLLQRPLPTTAARMAIKPSGEEKYTRPAYYRKRNANPSKHTQLLIRLYAHIVRLNRFKKRSYLIKKRRLSHFNVHWKFGLKSFFIWVMNKKKQCLLATTPAQLFTKANESREIRYSMNHWVNLALTLQKILIVTKIKRITFFMYGRHRRSSLLMRTFLRIKKRTGVRIFKQNGRSYKKIISTRVTPFRVRYGVFNEAHPHGYYKTKKKRRIQRKIRRRIQKRNNIID